MIEPDPAGTVVNWAIRFSTRASTAVISTATTTCDRERAVRHRAEVLHDGSKLLFQIGKKGVLDSSDGTAKGKPLNSNAAQFYMPSSIFVDRQNGDVYVSDGEGAGGNRRVAVMDRAGKFLRQWLPEGMETVHCMTMARDGRVYVCNRLAGRIQVYDKSGKFIRNIEIPWKPFTPVPPGTTREQGGAAVALELSRDANQSLMFRQPEQRADSGDRSVERRAARPSAVARPPGQLDQARGIAKTQGNVFVA